MVMALERGVAQGELQRACRLSWIQVKKWQASEWRGRAKRGPEVAEAVRVFSVEDEASAVPGAAAERRGEAPTGEAMESAKAQELELRLGPWLVSVRLAGGVGQGRACSR